MGSGAGGLATAVTAAAHGLKVVVLEKSDKIGGTSALSGGVLWIPGNPVHNTIDSREEARRYLRHELGNLYDETQVEAYLDYGSKMVEFFERETELKFAPAAHPDYHPEQDGAVKVGRSIVAAPYDSSLLGADLKRLRPPLQAITFLGMMFNSGNTELKHFFNATKSMKSAAYVGKRLTSHFRDLLMYGKGVQVTSGNALIARLVKSLQNLGVPLVTNATVTALVNKGGRINGVTVQQGREVAQLSASRGVVLATGGFPHNESITQKTHVHKASGADHSSLAPLTNTGDGITLAEKVGAEFSPRCHHPAAWIPTSVILGNRDRQLLFPHLVDRYKPGFIAVLRNGKRFCNESDSYHDFGCALIAATRTETSAEAWIICGEQAIGKYGLGYAKPNPIPRGHHVRSGYLIRGKSVEELAKAAGIDPEGLSATVREYDKFAILGEDSEFGRGSSAFNRYLGDAAVQPNPNVAPIGSGPYYAVKIRMGDLGTYDGLRTDVYGNVLDKEGSGIPGLYAVGNDRESVMRGAYPGGGITIGPAMTFGFVTALHLSDNLKV